MMKKLVFVLAMGALLPAAASAQTGTPPVRPDTVQPPPPPPAPRRAGARRLQTPVTPPAVQTPPAQGRMVRPRNPQPLGVPVPMPAAPGQQAPRAMGRMRAGRVQPMQPPQPMQPMQPMRPGQPMPPMGAARAQRVPMAGMQGTPQGRMRADMLRQQAQMRGNLGRARLQQMQRGQGAPRAAIVRRGAIGQGGAQRGAGIMVPGRMQGGDPLINRLPELRERLNLTDDQVARIREISEHAQKEREEALKEQREDLQKQQQRMNELRQKLTEQTRKDQVEAQKKILDVLTAEQKKQLEEMRSRQGGGGGR